MRVNKDRIFKIIKSEEVFVKRNLISSLIGVVLGSLLLSGCDDSQKSAKVFPTVVRKYTQNTAIEGIVSNNKGVLKTGHVKVISTSDQLITQANLDSGHYKVDIPANTDLPILIIATAEGETEKLSVAVVDDSIKQYQINPTTTAIAKAAKAMGGYTRANLVRAAEETVHVPDANKTTTGWRGDPTTQYGGWH